MVETPVTDGLLQSHQFDRESYFERSAAVTVVENATDIAAVQSMNSDTVEVFVANGFVVMEREQHSEALQETE